jgi:hypothetical protein
MNKALSLLLALLVASPAWAAFPVVATSNESQESSDTTTHNLAYPASPAAGDLLMFFFAVDGNTTISAGVAGWDLVCSTATTEYSEYVYSKIAVGGESGTLDLTSSASERSAHIFLRITGAHATTVPTCTIDAGSTTNANPNPPSHDPATWGTEDTLWIAGFLKNIDNDTMSANPTDYINEILSDSSATGTNAGVQTAIATRALNAASVDPGTFTISASRAWRAFTVAVRPSDARRRRQPTVFP